MSPAKAGTPTLLFFAEDDDAVCIRAFGIVLHAPAVGCLGKLLVINQDEKRSQPCLDADRNDGFFELELAAAYFAHFESDMAAAPQQPMEFAKNLSHRGLPILQFFRHRQSN